MNKQRGFTLFEVIWLILLLIGMGAAGTLFYWVIRALMKFAGS